MNRQKKNIILVIVVALIVLAIGYLEAKKPQVVQVGNDEIILNDAGSGAATTSTSTEVVAANRTIVRTGKVLTYPRAKEFVDPQGFINSDPFKLSDLVGKKVLLIDFWTYSCINCRRTVPYLNAWYKKYRDQGLEIIGVHTPEFDFEKNYNNVARAVKDLGIQYPVVLDSNLGTWTAYQNSYWPREYLIDIDGFIVHDHIGEGDYDKTEEAIQQALAERNTALGLNTKISSGISNPSDVIQMDGSKVKSQETYFGSGRNVYLANGVQGQVGSQNLTLPSTTDPDKLYLDGNWDFQPEFATNKNNGSKILFKYNAKNVYFVGSAASDVSVKIFQDGKLINTLTIKDNKLYTLIQGDNYGQHTLEIEIDGVGLEAYTFTFG